MHPHHPSWTTHTSGGKRSETGPLVRLAAEEMLHEILPEGLSDNYL
jgi:hypothetical protein